MKRTEENNAQEKPVFTIESSDHPQSSQGLSEKPVITIESDEDGNNDDNPQYVTPGKRQNRLRVWGLRAVGLVAVAVVMLLCYWGIRLYNYYYNIGVGVSVSPKENIEKLDGMKAQGGPSEVVQKSDSVLGVALNIYELHNVKAEMTLVEPDTADHTVLMYTRTADYTATGRYLGSLVIDGEEKRSDVSRLGYCAIANGNMVIGISRFDDMKDCMIDRRGSYFRQFVLVSDGELPTRFFLHGKVERKAIARTADDRLRIIETRHPETLWDFADALRECGFVDAIYLTGGNESGFYRSPDNVPHFTEKAAAYRNDKHSGVAPWLVLKKR